LKGMLRYGFLKVEATGEREWCSLRSKALEANGTRTDGAIACRTDQAEQEILAD
jgi:hypothetical protein